MEIYLVTLSNTSRYTLKVFKSQTMFMTQGPETPKCMSCRLSDAQNKKISLAAAEKTSHFLQKTQSFHALKSPEKLEAVQVLLSQGLRGDETIWPKALVA